MSTVYMDREDIDFQYKVNDGKPFYTALVAQGFDENASRVASKTIYPGGKAGASGDTYTAIY